jgi:RAD50-interacting protein 1
VYNLKEEINAKLEISAEEAAKPYNRLQGIARALRERNEKAEGTIIHLVDFVKEAETAAWNEMHQTLSGKFKAVLDKLRWPSAELVLGETRREFEDVFAALLVVEEPYVIYSLSICAC